MPLRASPSNPSLEALLTSMGLVEQAAELAERKRNAEARQAERAERERLKALPPRFVIHTIHGTYANDATWIKSESAFCETLKRDLGWRMRVEPFVWERHHNSVRARWNAAMAFRDHFRRLFAEYLLQHRAYRREHDDFREDPPKHVVIAHSHGGSVAFMAFAAPELARKVFKVITLATPFLEARLRQRGDEELVDLGTGFFAGTFGAWAVLFYGFYLGLGWGLWPWAIAAWFGVVLVLSGGAWVIGQMKRNAERLHSMMPETSLEPDQVEIVRVAGDEALALIAGARLAGTLSDLLWAATGGKAYRVIEKLLNYVDYASMRTFHRQWKESVLKRDEPPGPLRAPWTEQSSWGPTTGQVGFQVVAILLLTAFQEGTQAEQVWTMVAASIYALPAALSVLVILVGVPFAFLSSVSLVFCGLSVPFAGPHLAISAEPAPRGSWRVTQFNPIEGEGDLFHSQSYNDPRVPLQIGAWLASAAGGNSR